MSGKRYRILLLEDNPYDAELTIHLISELSIDTEVVLCKTGKEFEEKLQPFAPHVVISDYDLPHYTGGKALTHLQQVDRDKLVPFILVSGVVPLERASEMMQMGMFDMIDKSNLQSLGPALLRAIQVADERKAAHKQAELLRKVGAISRIGGWELDLRTDTLTWTEITKEVHEVPQDYEPKLETAILFFKEGWSRDLIEKCVREAVEDGKSYDVELILVTAKGNERWVRTLGEPMYRDGRITGIYGTILDITKERRKREDQLRLARRYEKVLDATKAGTLDWNLTNNEVIIDENVAAMGGYHIEELASLNIDGEWYTDIEGLLRFVDVDDEQALIKHIVEHGTGELDKLQIEFRIIAKDSRQEVWVLGRGSIVEWDDNGKPTRAVAAILNITDLKQLEQE